MATETDTPVEYSKKDKERFRKFIDLGDITQHNVKQLEIINSAVLPLTYQEKFYKDVLNFGELAKFAYFRDVVVGAVCSRVEVKDGKKKLYVMTLGVLAPYRRLGIATILIKHLLNYATADSSINEIYLHVQITNNVAISFYSQFDFSVAETVENYYKKIDPPDAYILRKTFS